MDNTVGCFKWSFEENVNTATYFRVRIIYSLQILQEKDFKRIPGNEHEIFVSMRLPLPRNRT